MSRNHTTAPIVDSYGNPVGRAKVEAYDVTDSSLQETQYTNSSGIASFVALHDTHDSDLKIMWGLFNVVWRRHIFETGGGGGTPSSDHGALTGLSDDDHSIYHTNARGDARYYTETELDAGQLDNRYFRENEHLATSAGAGDAGKPIKLDAGGKVDDSMLNDADIDHGSIGGLDGDDHPQYIKDSEFTAADEIIVGTGAGTFGQVTLAASQFLAKKAAGAATNVTAAEARTILNVADGSVGEGTVIALILGLGG